MYAAPTCGRMLRDFGAEVIKVEDPTSGDYARQWTPMKNGQSFGFARLNSGKRSVALDLRTEQGHDLVRRLATEVDVIIENFRPGRMDEWGLGYAALSEINPRLVMTSVSGFGQFGPDNGKPGFGTVAETGSGFAYINGWPETPPTSPPFGFADSIAGISAAMGTAMSLYRRERDGPGRPGRHRALRAADVHRRRHDHELLRHRVRTGPGRQRHRLGVAARRLPGRPTASGSRSRHPTRASPSGSSPRWTDPS